MKDYWKWIPRTSQASSKWMLNELARFTTPRAKSTRKKWHPSELRWSDENFRETDSWPHARAAKKSLPRKRSPRLICQPRRSLRLRLRRKPATDLISPSRKKSQTESRTASEDGCSADQQSETTSRCPGIPAPAVEPVAEPPPPKPESVSLIDDTRSKRSESSGTEPKIKSVLPPISKIRPPILTKAPEPVVQPIQPVLSGSRSGSGGQRTVCAL